MSQLHIAGIRVETQYIDNAGEPHISWLMRPDIPMGYKNTPNLDFHFQWLIPYINCFSFDITNISLL